MYLYIFVGHFWWCILNHSKDFLLLPYSESMITCHLFCIWRAGQQQNYSRREEPCSGPSWRGVDIHLTSFTIFLHINKAGIIIPVVKAFRSLSWYISLRYHIRIDTNPVSKEEYSQSSNQRKLPPHPDIRPTETKRMISKRCTRLLLSMALFVTDANGR